MEAPPINEDQMEQVLQWIDGLSFSRPKKNLSRDFSDGVLVAQILKQYHPKLVQLHNYPSASALNAKFNNWKTLNEKVFKKLKFSIHPSDIQNVITIVPGAVEKVLFLIYTQLSNKQNKQKQKSSINSQQIEQKSFSRIENAENAQISAQLAERQETLKELKSTIQILETKMRKIEQLNRLKDIKIQSLIRKLEQGIN